MQARNQEELAIERVLDCGLLSRSIDERPDGTLAKLQRKKGAGGCVRRLCP